MDPINQSKADQLDEKTARIIEEMDKSLLTMEKSLGPDHEVIAKILDSYAKLLRQNNIRHLDAVNMEARAKHIRAKHNIEQDKSQSANLAPVQHKKGMSVKQVKLAVYSVCAIAVVGFGILTLDTFKSSNKMNTGKARKLFGQRFGKKGNEPPVVITTTQLAPPEEEDVVGKAHAEALVELNRASSGNVPQSSGLSPSTPSPTSAAAEPTVDTSKLALIAKVKSFAREKVTEGMEFERNKDFQNAANNYHSVIDFANQNASQIQQPIFSEYIAKAFDGYGRMAELNNQPDIKEQTDKTAAEIRSHLNGSEDE